MYAACSEDLHASVDNFNDTDDSKTLGPCLHQLLEQVVPKYSNKVALICGDASLTYVQLDALTSRFARTLTERGVSNGDLIGVALKRSVELVAVLLAVMRTGAAYVPIDPAFPAERINQMLEDAHPKLVITGGVSLDEFASWESMCLDVDAMLHIAGSGMDSNVLDVVVKSDDLAYVMYTSGSTGRPKGVEVSHGNVANLLLSMKREPGCSETDRLLAVTTVSFDMAVLELFLPLLCGATTIIAQRHEVRDPEALIGLMTHHGVTMMQGTPAMWHMLLDSGWRGQPRLTKILCGGEALPRPLADQLLACSDMAWNLYGPTETTVYASIWKVCQDHEVVIGKPITNGHLYVLDINLSPVSIGCPGELYIGGAGVARGYRNLDELSRSRFLSNPFHGGLMYRTGDLAVFSAPGKLRVIGRIDGQVKIRGYRIELGDIEKAITDHAGISRAVVVCRDERLVAYYVSKKNRPSLEGEDQTALRRAIRKWLAERLPSYMVPAFFIELDAFPVTMNGKIDRKALPEVVTTGGTDTDVDIGVNHPSYWESRLQGIWSKALGHNHFSIMDNFFEVGGDSLRAVRVQKELEKLIGRPVSISTLFEHYTIKALAVCLDRTSATGPKPESKPHVTGGTEDIAIVSMACRLPGDITTPEEFWKLLVNGGDAIIEVPRGRWGDSIGDDNLSPQDKSFCRKGGFISTIDSYDISLFGISPREACRLDPAQYMMLETCWEVFERAGYTMEQLRNSNTGVYIGTSNILAHQSMNAGAVRNLEDFDGYTVTGSAGGTMSGRISYQLGLAGPSMTIDTACSSSLVATHLACNALRLGECDTAVSGAVSLMLNPGLHVEFSRLKGMAPDGRCRAFSEDAQGTGWSEGAVAVVLKRLSDARRDGDSVHAVIRGTAINHDGRSASLTTPSSSAQQRLVQTALKAARLQPDDIDYVEAHGTGTRLGDPIEAAALANVFSTNRENTQPLWLGSVKSNVGHTQAAAGLVGLLKVVLSLKHQMLPQTLHVTVPTTAIDWQKANMMLVLNQRPWLAQKSRLRRAGVSAFGIGGTNSHVIVEESCNEKVVTHGYSSSSPRPTIIPFLLSGDNDVALRLQAEKLHKYISNSSEQEDFGNLAFSLATTRTHHRKRSVVMANAKAELLRKLESFSQPSALALPISEYGEVPRLAMLFTGQGSQWPGMGKDLCACFPLFHRIISEIAAEFTDFEMPLLDVMWAKPGSTTAALLDRTDFAQPAIFALEVALYRLWESWNLLPEFVLGHSLGELVAAHVAGILDLPDACRLVAARGRLMQAQTGNYKMVSLGAGSNEVATAIEQVGVRGKIDIAAYNTPTQTVISGDSDIVDSIASNIAKQGNNTKTLVTGHAFHSRHIDGMLEEFQVVAQSVRFHPPRFRIISSLAGRLATQNELQQPHYWVNQAREPVRFYESLQALAHHGANVFLEVGPRPVLSNMGMEILAHHDKKESFVWLSPLNNNGKDNVLGLQRAVADLHIRHMRIDWQGYFKPFGLQRIELPTYAFQRDYHNGYDAKRSIDIDEQRRSSIKATADLASRGLRKEVGGFEYEIVWHLMDINATVNGTWGVLLPNGETSWTALVMNSISQAGIQLGVIKDFREVERLDGLVCLWDSDIEFRSQTQDFLKIALSQLQMAAELQLTLPLVWITHQAIGVRDDADDRALKLGAAPLWGLVRTARSEHPELQVRLIDLDDGEWGNSIRSALTQIVEPECSIRRGKILAPRMLRVVPAAKPSAKQHIIRPDGAVLITGGLGDLGVLVAQWLVNNHGVRDLVLTSRRGIATAGSAAILAQLSTPGVEVTVIASDVAKADDVESIMALFNEDRPLRGIVHAAGVVDSGVLSAMTLERCMTTLEPKVYGAWLLHQATLNLDLDLFMMFSSISGVMGMPGLANYAAANVFLDSLAHLRRAKHLPATSVAYGTWSGDGMASRLSRATNSHLNHFGLDPLSPEEGLDLFEMAVSSNRALTIAAALDLRRFRQYHEEIGGIPPLLRSLIGQEVPRGSRDANMNDILNKADPAQHINIILEMIRGVAAKTLGFEHASDVNIDRPLQDIGIDSLTAVQIRNHLAALTGLTLSVNITFLHPNIRALGQFLLSQLQYIDTPSTSTAPSSVTSDTTLSRTPQLDMASLRKGCLDRNFKYGNITQHITQGKVCPEAVLLTGATGFVGAFVLNELLERGISTYCLVRAKTVDEALRRVVSTLEDYGLWKARFAPYVIPMTGDLSQPMLGLAEELFDELTERVDAICHCGALVDWMRPLEDYIGPNVVSTHEILRLASQGRAKAIHLVSTISSLPLHMGLDLTEEHAEYGYGTSKYIAERLVSAARWRGARATVYRLPFVTASTSTGRFRRDRGDFLHNLIVGSRELGAFPLANADMSAVLPVDYLSKTIVTIMTEDMHRIGRDYDFLNTTAPNFNDFFKMISSASGGQDVIPFDKWKRRALDYATAHPKCSLARISAVIDGYTNDTAADMFKGHPVGEHVLGGKDYPTPLLNELFVRTYTDCIDGGQD